MPVFKLSKRSLKNLEGVRPELVAAVRRAIDITDVDFGVTCGLRTREEQEILVKKGLSHTMQSRHLTGDAVDLVAYLQGRVTWEMPAYYEVAEAMVEAAEDVGIVLRWGGAWHIPDMTIYTGTPKDAHMDYIRKRVEAGREPFIDGPHFEIPG